MEGLDCVPSVAYFASLHVCASENTCTSVDMHRAREHFYHSVPASKAVVKPFSTLMETPTKA